MRTKDELFRAAQREVAARRQQAVMQAETARLQCLFPARLSYIFQQCCLPPA